MDKIIEVKNLVKKYGDFTAVNGLTFDVYRGETFSIIGPNGSGKTTTVEILECIRAPTSGEVKVLGYDVVKEDKKIKKRIGVLPQDFDAFDRLTVEENVRVIGEMYDSSLEVRELLEEFGLWEVRKRKYGKLSGGQKRKVGICMAIVNDPEIVFLDEPTTGLDPKAREECWSVLEKLKDSGKTIFLTSHYMEEVERLGDRVSILYRGKMLDVGDIEDLVSRYGGGIKIVIKAKDLKYIKAMVDTLGEMSVDNGRVGAGRREGVTFIVESKEEALELASKLIDIGVEFEIKEPSLEDVFLHLAEGVINERGELV